MILNKTRRRNLDYTWPGFVDALSSLLMVIIFVLIIFVLSQFFLSQKMSGQDEALVELNNNLTELSELLSIEREATTELTSQLSILESKIINLKTDLDEKRIITSQYIEEIAGKDNIISMTQIEIGKLKDIINQKNQVSLDNKNTLVQLTKDNKVKDSQIIDKQNKIRASHEEIKILISASLKLRNKLSQLQTLLSAYKAKDKKDKIKVISLGKDVNSALARRVEELQKFKSDFFGRYFGGILTKFTTDFEVRSEERRVGKECRSRWSPYH